MGLKNRFSNSSGYLLAYFAFGTLTHSGSYTSVAALCHGDDEKRARSRFLITANAVPVLDCVVRENRVCLVRPVGGFKQFFELRHQSNFFYEAFSSFASHSLYRPRRHLQIDKFPKTVFSALKSLFITGQLSEQRLMELKLEFLEITLRDTLQGAGLRRLFAVMGAIIQTLQAHYGECVLNERTQQGILVCHKLRRLLYGSESVTELLVCVRSGKAEIPLFLAQSRDDGMCVSQTLTESFIPGLNPPGGALGEMKLPVAEIRRNQSYCLRACIVALVKRYESEIELMPFLQQLHCFLERLSGSGDSQEPVSIAEFLGRHGKELRILERANGALVGHF